MEGSNTEACPTCNGKKTVYTFRNTGSDSSTHTSGYVDCHTCSGAGAITIEHAERISEGRLAKWERISRGETLKDAAERMGITPAGLCKIERGES